MSAGVPRNAAAGVTPIRRVPFDWKNVAGPGRGAPPGASKPVLGVRAGAVTTTCFVGASCARPPRRVSPSFCVGCWTEYIDVSRGVCSYVQRPCGVVVFLVWIDSFGDEAA